MLGELDGYLRDAGYPAQLIDASNEVPLATLVVPFNTDEQGRDRWLNVNVLPFEADNHNAPESLGLIQFYAPLQFHLAPDRQGDLARLIVAIGPEVPVGSFGIRESGEIYYRYMLVQRQHGLFDKEVVQELVNLIEFQLDTFSGALESVCNSEASVEDALASLK